MPLRNPGSFISPASCTAARSTRLSSASGSTATSIFTRDSGSSVTVVFKRAASLVALRLSRWIPDRTAIGTWSGGRFMHFGEPLDDERLAALLRPGGGIDTVITADVYGAGDADRLLGRSIEGLERDAFSLVGAVGHDFVDGERDGPRGFPRFTDPRLRGPDEYAAYLRRAAEASLERVGVDSFDLLLLHNPDRTGFTSEAVWDGMAALRDAGLADAIGVAPGPANGFTLDLIDCFERFGDRIDWAMVILNPLEPWPGELCLDAAAAQRRAGDHPGGRLRRPVLGRRPPRPRVRRARPPPLSPRRLGRGRQRAARADAPLGRGGRADPDRLACQWNLAHDPVACVAPTLIQEAGPDARPIEDKRPELAALPRAAAELRGGRRDPRDRRQHGLDDAQGREPRARGRRAAGPLAS